MALTKVTGQVVNTSTDLTVGVLTATTASFTGNVSVGGTLTYEDVTNVDSVGLITARNGISVTGSNISVESSEDRLLYLKSTDANAYLTFEDTDSSSGFANRIGSVSDGLYFSTGGGGERARIDSSGRFGLGTASPSNTLHVSGAGTIARLQSSTSTAALRFHNSAANDGYIKYISQDLTFTTADSERLRIDSSGRLLLGATSSVDVASTAAAELQVTTSSNITGAFYSTANAAGPAAILALGHARGSATGVLQSGDVMGEIRFAGGDGTDLETTGASIKAEVDGTPGSNDMPGRLIFSTTSDGASGVTERVRIDSSGRLLVGTSSTLDTSDEAIVHVVDTLGARLVLGRNDTSVADGNGLGGIRFVGNDTTSNTFTTLSEIICQADGTHAAGDNPTRLVFSTTADGSSSVTERMRIDSGGRLLIGTGTSPSGGDGHARNARLLVQGRVGVDADSGRLNLQRGSAASNGSSLGSISFTDNSNNIYARIESFADSTTGTDDYPGRITFSTTANGASSVTERMRIDNLGRLLLGFTSARANFFNAADSPKLQLESTTFVDSAISVVRNVNSGAAGGIIIGKTRGTSVGSNTVVQNGDSLGQISFQGADGSEMVEAAKVAAEIDSTPGANDMPGRLVFQTTGDGSSGSTERMRINSNGLTSVFGATESLRVRTVLTSSSSSIVIRLQSGATDIATGGSTRFQVLANGNVQNTNNSYGAISDQKLKENIVDANSQWDDLKAIQVRNYNFIEGQTHTQIGVVAQEVETVSPGLVSESPDIDDDGNDLGTVTKSVNYSVLYMKAVKALQEAQTRIESLEARLDAGGL